MIKFTQFSESERQFLSSVPYRVGHWISDCDDNARSTLDDRREAQALEKAISQMANLHRKMPFAAQVMRDIKSRKSQWSSWEAATTEAEILEDVKKAIDICREKGAQKALSQYKQAIWQIALIVAQSYGEHIDPDNEMHVDRIFAWMGSFVFSPKMAKAPENMSPKEKLALKKLRAVLKA